MKKLIPMALLLAVYSCHDDGAKTTAATTIATDTSSVVVKKDTVTVATTTTPLDTTNMILSKWGWVKPDTIFIPGHYFSPDVLDSAYVFLSKPGNWRKEVSEEEADEYTLGFTSPGLPQLPVFRNEIHVVNEGDLNGDGRDDITIFNEPDHGCLWDCTTHYFNPQNEWKQVGDIIMIHTDCEPYTEEEMRDRIFVEKGVAYRLEDDVSDGFEQKKVKLNFPKL